jgi:hypothetical protein
MAYGIQRGGLIGSSNTEREGFLPVATTATCFSVGSKVT